MKFSANEGLRAPALAFPYVSPTGTVLSDAGEKAVYERGRKRQSFDVVRFGVDSVGRIV